MLLGVDGGSDFDGLHSRKHVDKVILYAFDVLAADGDDLRKLPLAMRKTNRAVGRRPECIFGSDFDVGRSDPNCSGKPANSGLKG